MQKNKILIGTLATLFIVASYLIGIGAYFLIEKKLSKNQKIMRIIQTITL